MLDEGYVALVGTKHYWGTDALRPGQWVRLVKEPESNHDDEAIRVELASEAIKLGYVANSTRSVPRGCHSAGRIYDHIGDHIYGVIRFVLPNSAIIELMEGVTVITLIMKKGQPVDEGMDATEASPNLF